LADLRTLSKESSFSSNPISTKYFQCNLEIIYPNKRKRTAMLQCLPLSYIHMTTIQQNNTKIANPVY
jgi:hypothetical protein